MGNKINDTTNYPAVAPAATDRVLGIDVSNTTNDANGEVVTFQIDSIPLSLLSNDAGFLTSVTTADVTAAGALMDSEVTNLAQVKAFDTTDYATAAQGSTADSALQDVVSDTTPQLGGSLDVNGNKIVSTSNGNIDIEPNGTGNVLLGNFTFDADQAVGAGQDDYVLTYDNAAGTIGLEAAAGGGGGLVPISKTTASADAAVDIELTGGYAAYVVKLVQVQPATDGQTLRLRISDDSAVTFETTGYGYRYQTTSGAAGNFTSGAPAVLVTSAAGNAAGESINGDVTFTQTLTDEYPTAVYLASFVGGDGLIEGIFGAGHYRTAVAVTHLRFFFTSGNIASGEFHLYGIADGA